jgi:hypothetical protein
MVFMRSLKRVSTEKYFKINLIQFIELVNHESALKCLSFPENRLIIHSQRIYSSDHNMNMRMSDSYKDIVDRIREYVFRYAIILLFCFIVTTLLKPFPELHVKSKCLQRSKYF